MAKNVFEIRVYEDHVIITGDDVKVPITTFEFEKVVPILRGIAGFGTKKPRKKRTSKVSQAVSGGVT